MVRTRPALDKKEALGVVAVLTIGLVALTGTLELDAATDLIAITGFVVLLPLIGILGDRLPFVVDSDAAEGETTAADENSRRTDSAEDGPVAELRDRYARGEIDEAEFERRLDRLLETEDLEGAADRSDERLMELE